MLFPLAQALDGLLQGDLLQPLLVGIFGVADLIHDAGALPGGQLVDALICAAVLIGAREVGQKRTQVGDAELGEAFGARFAHALDVANVGMKFGHARTSFEKKAAPAAFRVSKLFAVRPARGSFPRLFADIIDVAEAQTVFLEHFALLHRHPVGRGVEIGEEAVRLGTGLDCGDEHAVAIGEKRPIDARAADDDRVGSGKRCGLLNGVRDLRALDGEVAVAEDDIAAVGQRLAAGESGERPAAEDHGFAGRERAEALEVGGNAEQKLTVTANAPVFGNANDCLHGITSNRNGDLVLKRTVFVALKAEAVAREGVKIGDGGVDKELRRGMLRL